jgi:hypothetical protein
MLHCHNLEHEDYAMMTRFDDLSQTKRAECVIARPDPLPPLLSRLGERGSDLTAAAEKVFGWKNVHKHDGELVGKK